MSITKICRYLVLSFSVLFQHLLRKSSIENYTNVWRHDAKWSLTLSADMCVNPKAGSVIIEKPSTKNAILDSWSNRIGTMTTFTGRGERVKDVPSGWVPRPPPGASYPTLPSSWIPSDPLMIDSFWWVFLNWFTRLKRRYFGDILGFRRQFWNLECL